MTWAWNLTVKEYLRIRSVILPSQKMKVKYEDVYVSNFACMFPSSWNQYSPLLIQQMDHFSVFRVPNSYIQVHSNHLAYFFKFFFQTNCNKCFQHTLECNIWLQLFFVLHFHLKKSFLKYPEWLFETESHEDVSLFLERVLIQCWLVDGLIQSERELYCLN